MCRPHSLHDIEYANTHFEWTSSLQKSTPRISLCIVDIYLEKTGPSLGDTMGPRSQASSDGQITPCWAHGNRYENHPEELGRGCGTYGPPYEILADLWLKISAYGWQQQRKTRLTQANRKGVGVLIHLTQAYWKGAGGFDPYDSGLQEGDGCLIPFDLGLQKGGGRVGVLTPSDSDLL